MDSIMSEFLFQWLESSLLPPGLFHLNTPEPSDGQTYVMYHGTTRANAKKIKANGFQRSAGGMLGPGVYLSRDLEKARRYPINHPDKDRVIIKVKVNVGRVITIRNQNHRLQKTWSSHGYDSAWVPPNCGMVASGLEENCIWDPSRIEVIELIKPQLLRAPSPAPSIVSVPAVSPDRTQLTLDHYLRCAISRIPHQSNTFTGLSSSSSSSSLGPTFNHCSSNPQRHPASSHATYLRHANLLTSGLLISMASTSTPGPLLDLISKRRVQTPLRQILLPRKQGRP